eukprot:CAMPEP_0170312202 /NCGR_PEP_ID=MMETSP0116_2-20130129/56631_1 /TAXON_ID=400756 /ORGANISM="Durinskia baltica, Strain CSIRO CS-38" /LENGTH=69 /DNA_ID=CAMNT_0010564565 /DNA_START=175 /DNA_END=384 /DNA_ORIENTATION=+
MSMILDGKNAYKVALPTGLSTRKMRCLLSSRNISAWKPSHEDGGSSPQPLCTSQVPAPHSSSSDSNCAL